MQEAVNTQGLIGIDRDTQPELQTQGTYRFALNMKESMGSMAQIENMNSNELCVELPGNIIGSVYLTDKFLLFITDNTNSEIGYFYPNECLYEKIEIPCNLNFSTQYPIQAVYKVSQVCDGYSIYWTDGINPVRYIELEDLPKDCNDLTLFNCQSLPSLEVTSVNDGGGNLMCGSYSFAIRYKKKTGETTSFFSITNPVSIYDDPFNSIPWRFIDGCPGGETTTKSITLTISNIDTNYDYYELAILFHANGVNSHKLIENIPITTTVFQVTNNGLTDIDILEVVIPLAKWKYADLITIHQDRLFLGGVQDVRDIEFQKQANDIKIEWFTIKIPIKDAYKNPLYQKYRSFMGDEKYAFGIVLEFCDGSTTPFAFHIPGPTEEDITCFTFPLLSKLLIEEGQPLQDIQYNDLWDIVPENDINNFFDCEKYVWEVFNTAGICETPEEEFIIEEDCGIVTNIIPGKWHSGHMAFTEECEIYPDTKGCDDKPIYPHIENPDGSFTMKKVRHHRMPSRRLEPHFEGATPIATDCPQDSPSFTSRPWENHFIFPIGIKVSNIDISSVTDAVGYKIVMVKRDDTNKSIIGKGLMHKGFYGHDEVTGKQYIFPPYVVNDSNSVSPLTPATGVTNFEQCQVYKFHSPDTSFSTPLLDSVYFHYESELGGNSRHYGIQGTNVIGEQCCAARFNVNTINYNDLNVFQHNSKVELPTYIAANTFLNNVYEASYYNIFGESGVLFRINGGAYPFVNNQFCSSGAATNYSDNSYFMYTQGADFCTENVVSCVRAFYGGLKRYRCNQYDSIPSLKYIDVSRESSQTTETEIFGDSFINYWAYARYGPTSGYILNQAECYNQEDLKLPGYPYTAVIHTICESDINVDLRYEKNVSEPYVPNLNKGAMNLDVQIDQPGTVWSEAFLSKFHLNLETGSHVNVGINNYFTYNHDFSRVNDHRVYSGLPVHYSPCDCKNTYVNSIAASDLSLGIKDGWRIFRVNNIISIPKNTGRLMNIFTMNNNFFAHTEHNIWQIITAGTQLQANAANVYLGSGDIFSSVPQYIYAVPEGLGGIQQSEGFLLNQLGYLFIDNVGAKLINLNQGISFLEKGLVSWLRDNLIFQIKKLVPEFPIAYTDKVGWHIGYDYTNSLILITKKDFSLKDESLYYGLYDETNCEINKIYFNQDLNSFVKIINNNCNFEIIEYNTNEYLCNVSWTLSYSPIRKMFKSWHSFIPDYYLYDRYNLFTSKNGSIYKHNIPHKYQTYYGINYPSSIELLTKNKQTAFWDNAYLLQEAYEYNNQYKKELNVDSPPSYGFIYNKTQNSGILNFYHTTDYDDDYMSKSINNSNLVKIFKKNDVWTYNDFNDYVIDNTIPHTTCECLDPIDEIPNTDAIDFNKPYYIISQFRGLYLIQRLYWNTETKRYVTTLLTNSITYTNV